MSDDGKQSSQLIAAWAQVVAMCLGIGALILAMGRKDQQLSTTTSQVKELSSIVSELAKANIGFALTDKQTEDRLRELNSRLERLERH